MDLELYTFRSDAMLNFRYAQHRMCVNHSKLMAVCTTVPSEFFADAKVLYGKRCEQFEEAKRIEAVWQAANIKRINEAKRVADQAAHIKRMDAKRIEEAKRVADQAAHIKRIEDANRAAEAKRVAGEKCFARADVDLTTRKWQGDKRQCTQQPFGTFAKLVPETELHRRYRQGEISIDEYLYEREPGRVVGS